MPAASEIAEELADRLVQIGQILGYDSRREAPVLEESKHRVDVLWQASGAFNIAAIEIQYSPSQVSISHNIFKSEPTLHPSLHVVISFSKLTDEYKEILSLYHAVAIFEGQEDVDRINGWLLRVIEEKDKIKQIELGKQFVLFLKNRKRIDVQKEKLLHELWLERLFEPVVFEITVWARYPEGSGERGHTFFVTGAVETAKATALKYFEDLFADVPFELDGKCLLLDRLQITCYQRVYRVETEHEKHEGTAFKVVVDGKIGNEDDYFEFTDSGFGLDPKEVEVDLTKRLRKDIELMKHFQHRIIEQQSYFAKYTRIASWKEKARGEVLMSTQIIPSKEEQERILQEFFYKEFGFSVSDFLSLHEIDSKCRYSENLDYVKRRLGDLFEEDMEAFRYRMNETEIRKFADWLGVLR